MEEDFNKIPEEYKPKRFNTNYIVLAFIIFVIFVFIWAFATGRLP